MNAAQRRRQRRAAGLTTAAGWETLADAALRVVLLEQRSSADAYRAVILALDRAGSAGYFEYRFCGRTQCTRTADWPVERLLEAAAAASAADKLSEASGWCGPVEAARSVARAVGWTAKP